MVLILTVLYLKISTSLFLDHWFFKPGFHYERYEVTVHCKKVGEDPTKRH